MTSTEHGTFQGTCRYAVRPRFDQTRFINDFSILHLRKPLQIGPRVVPARLPPSKHASFFLRGKRLTVSGWGALGGGEKPSVLHKVHLPGVRNFQCLKYYPGIIDSSKLCAGPTTSGVESYQGGSGGTQLHN